MKGFVTLCIFAAASAVKVSFEQHAVSIEKGDYPAKRGIMTEQTAIDHIGAALVGSGLIMLNPNCNDTRCTAVSCVYCSTGGCTAACDTAAKACYTDEQQHGCPERMVCMADSVYHPYAVGQCREKVVRLFLTRNTTTGGGADVTGDALCKAEAAAAGLALPYDYVFGDCVALALSGYAATNARNRTVAGSPVSGNFSEPILHADKSVPESTRFWSGCASAGVVAGPSSCANSTGDGRCAVGTGASWATSAAMSWGTAGDAAGGSAWLNRSPCETCDTRLPVLCMIIEPRVW